MSRIKVFYIHHAQLALSILAIILAYATGNVILPGIFLYLVWGFELLKFLFPVKILSWMMGGDPTPNMFTLRLMAFVSILNIVVIALSQFSIIGPVWLKVVAIESVVFYLIVELYNFTR